MVGKELVDGAEKTGRMGGDEMKTGVKGIVRKPQ